MIYNQPQSDSVRPPRVAGQFYPAGAEELRQKISYYLNKAKQAGGKKKTEQDLLGLMVPHAGYDFSGQAAAYAYFLLEGRQADTVVVVCNAHSVPFYGIAVDPSDAWETPLGRVAVNRGMADELVASHESIKFDSQVHALDHTLEVQLPFLQTVLAGTFRVLPILIGAPESPKHDQSHVLADVLRGVMGESDLLLASSDMSHYPSYEQANEIDRETLAVIEKGDSKELKEYLRALEKKGIPNEHTALCGEDAVRTLLNIWSTSGGGEIDTLYYANSGDTALGDKDAVVGYGVVAFWRAAVGGNDPGRGAEAKVQLSYGLTEAQKQTLLRIARQTVESYAASGHIPDFDITDNRLARNEGAFVTLKKQGRLRGCIGQIVPADKPLWQVVRDQAVAAASEDPRFPPVTPGEFSDIEYEVSVLSKPEKIDDWRKVKPGQHGVIVRKGRQGGVFLPQVATEAGWDREELLSSLCAHKAGLPADSYKSDDVELQVFTAQVIGDRKH